MDIADGNTVEVDGEVTLTGRIGGTGNYIRITAQQPSQIELRVNGDDNRVTISDAIAIRKFQLRIGNHIPASQCTFAAEPELSIEPGTRALLFNDRNVVTFGRDCMIAGNVTIRAGESPHLLFDLDTGEYLDRSDGIFFGDHVWIGEGAYITKRVTVPDGCVVAAHSVVTRRFDEPNSAIGGNPAVVVRSGIKWLRNRGKLVPGSPEKASYDAVKIRPRSRN